MSNDINDKKQQLARKKARIVQEETRLKIKERKARMAHLIKMGGVLQQAELDHLPIETLLGACIFLKETIRSKPEVIESWQQSGKQELEKESQDKIAVIIKFSDSKISSDTRSIVRSYGLKWNSLRKEWYGHTADLENLKASLKDVKFDLELINN